MGTDREEIEANQFAAEVLMPDYLMIPELRKLGLDSWDVSQAGAVAEQLTDLAAQCKVSEQALVLRIGTLVG
jgi:Zn-dependent peptidase ImmA (M78 family)